MKLKPKIIYSIGGVALSVTSAAAIALPLIVKHIAEKTTKGILSKIIPLDGPENNLADRGELKMVALGDSVTAGYNGFMASGDKDSTMKGDYLSYADFLANDLKKAGKLKEYRNYAKSGDKIPDTRQRIFRDAEALKSVKQADLITISLGANDLLALAEIIKLPYSMLVGNKSIGDKIVEVNNARDAIEGLLGLNSASREDINNYEDESKVGEDTKHFGHRDGSISGFASTNDMKRLISQTFEKFTTMLNSGSLAGLVDMEQELLDKVFDIIELDFSTLLVELHTAAPQAKIVTIGYAFPFHLFPDSVLNGKLPEDREINGNKVSVMDVYKEFMNTYKRVADRSNYVQFFNVNDLKEFTDQSDPVKYTIKGDATHLNQEVTKDEWFRAMPNPLDIHPSTYGHQLIGNYLYEFISKTDLNKTLIPYKSIQKIENFDPTKSELDDIYTYAGFDKGFDIKDETLAYFNKATMIKNALDKISDPGVLKFIGHVLDVMMTPEQFTKLISDLMIDKDDIQSIFMHMSHNQPKLYRGLIALVLYLTNGGTQVGDIKPQKEALEPLLKMVGGLFDASEMLQKLGAIFGYRHSSYDGSQHSYLEFMKEVVEVGKEMGFDISNILPQGWDTDTTEWKATRILQPDTNAIIGEQSFFIESLAKLGLTKPWGVVGRNTLLTPEIANDEAHSHYYIKSFSGDDTHAPQMTIEVLDINHLDATAVKDEIGKAITTPGSLRISQFSAVYARNATITFVDSTGHTLGTATLNLSSLTFAKDQSGLAPAASWITAVNNEINAKLNGAFFTGLHPQQP